MSISNPCPSQIRQRGFTLLEVMLAFVLLAAALGLLLGMLSRGLRQVTQSQGESEATLYAQSLVDQMGALEPIHPGRSDGDFGGGRYHYQLEISEIPDPAATPPAPDSTPAGNAQKPIGAPVLYRIALEVSWGAAEPAQRLRFLTLRARTPTTAGSP